MNEIGKRLGYEVENGRYQGTVNQSGFDGLWFDGQNHLLVEVKTTDAYRINLDTIRGYAEKIDEKARDNRNYSTLIVVGRQDTGDLEAQVRGSRHAWSARLISVEALIKLMFINEEVDDKNLVARIRRVLLPFEYTRVDNIIDLVFEAQQESDQKAQTINEISIEGEPEKREGARYEFTPRAQLETKRSQAVSAFFRLKGSGTPVRHTSTNYSDALNKIGVTCAVSKRYRRDYQPYWYALHPQWLEFLKSKQSGYFILACMDRDEAYALPVKLLEGHLSELNKTEKEDRYYWHVALAKDGDRLALNLSSVGKKIDLTPYQFRIA